MKAVIMAGGEGKRLKPVTGDIPKPMVPLLGRPMMEHIILLLKKHGFTDICASLRYRAGDITEYFGDGSALGVHLQYRIENEARGTAGGVKNCRDFWDGEDFLVISGDAACDFDLSALMAEHKAQAADVTLALYRHPEPLSYGLTVTDSGGRIRAFIEKPGWSRVVTDLVNTGIYAVSPQAMELVPDDRAFDFAKELFPALLERDRKLLGIKMDGYWCDVGSPLSYYKCCVDALEGRLKLDAGKEFAVSAPAAVVTEETDGEGTFSLECACRSRAELMGALSEAFYGMGADYGDGIHLSGARYKMHIFPMSSSSSVRISVASEDAEFARELALTARELAEAFNL